MRIARRISLLLSLACLSSLSLLLLLLLHCDKTSEIVLVKRAAHERAMHTDAHTKMQETGETDKEF